MANFSYRVATHGSFQAVDAPLDDIPAAGKPAVEAAFHNLLILLGNCDHQKLILCSRNQSRPAEYPLSPASFFGCSGQRRFASTIRGTNCWVSCSDPG